MRSALLIAAITVASLIQAQTPPAFDAASVKATVPPPGVTSMSRYGEYIGSLKSLIKTAYGLEDYQMAGGPKWIDDDIYSVVDKPVGPEASLMLRTLLAERFKLAVHSETRQLPVYTLVFAKGGPRLEKATEPGTTSPGGGMIRGTMEMSLLASYLSSITGRRVIDQTGLTGPYTFSLKWTPDDRPATGDTSAPSLVTAIQEQLGLKLESTKGPVEILVIDHAEKPTEN